MHRTTDRFWRCFERLPESVRFAQRLLREPLQKAARQNFQLLKTNPGHPSLHFKKVGKFWSVRADIAHRALAVEDGEDFIWVWIGSHDEYEQMINPNNPLQFTAAGCQSATFVCHNMLLLSIQQSN